MEVAVAIIAWIIVGIVAIAAFFAAVNIMVNRDYRDATKAAHEEMARRQRGCDEYWAARGVHH